MGWWETVSGAVIGDPPANYLDEFVSLGMTWADPENVPGEVRERLDALYMEGIGRASSDEDIRALLSFCGRVEN